LFAHSQSHSATEVVVVRLSGVGRVDKPEYKRSELEAVGKPALTRQHRIYFKGHGWVDSSLTAWEQWAPGEELRGPALVTREDSTLLVPFGWRARKDALGSAILER